MVILPALMNDITRVLYISMSTTTEGERTNSTRPNLKELPQIHIAFFGFFIEHATRLLKFGYNSSGKMRFDLGQDKLNRVAVTLDHIASRMTQLLHNDPRIVTEELQTLTYPLLNHFRMKPNSHNIKQLVDGLSRSAIVLKSILKEAKKQGIDEGWLLWALDGYLTDKKTTLSQLKASLNFRLPVPNEYSGKSYTYIQALAYVYHLEDREVAKRNLRFTLKAVPHWARFLAKSPLLVNEW